MTVISSEAKVSCLNLRVKYGPRPDGNYHLLFIFFNKLNYYLKDCNGGLSGIRNFCPAGAEGRGQIKK
jgi:hypothetical protein